MINTMLAWHREHYPHMQAQDIVKLVFQAYRGCGHLLGPEEAVARRIANECAAHSPNAQEPLTEPLGDRYVRLNLRRAMHERIPALWIARLMHMSCADDPHGSTGDVIDAVRMLAEEHGAPDLLSALQPLLNDSGWLPSHSSVYHEHYAPAYRVIERRFVYLLPVLCAAGALEKEHLCIAIDGRCGSGKSTLAKALASVIDAEIVFMDDFFTPHAQKTPERLALPGGNADVSRFRDEVLTPWLQTGTAVYRPYDCQRDCLTDPVAIPAGRSLIVEGSYALHPDAGRPYDVSVFLSVPYEEQCRRILDRDGEWMLNRFIREWIPLEEAYFSAFALPDASCLVLDQPDHC